MKRTKILIVSFFAIFLFSAGCRDDFRIEEVDKLTNELSLDGDIAGPLINTRVRLEQFLLPGNDSSVWAEVGSDKLIHIKGVRNDFQSFQMKDIYSGAPVTFPMSAGTSVPPGMYDFSSDTYPVDIFSSILSGEFFIKAPEFKFRVKSEAPLLDTLNINILKFYNSDKVVKKEINDLQFDVNPATEQGVAKHTVLVIDTAKLANFPVELSTLPQYISFDISTGNSKSAPLPFDATGEEPVNIGFDYDFPLEVALKDVRMKQFVDFDAAKQDVDKIENAEFKLIVENNYPIDIYLQAYFDNGIKEVDSLFEQELTIPRAELDAQNQVSKFNIKKEIVIMSKERFEKLKAAGVKEISICFKMNTPDADSRRYVKIQEGNFLGVKLGFKIKYSVSTSEL